MPQASSSNWPSMQINENQRQASSSVTLPKPKNPSFHLQGRKNAVFKERSSEAFWLAQKVSLQNGQRLGGWKGNIRKTKALETVQEKLSCSFSCSFNRLLCLFLCALGALCLTWRSDFADRMMFPIQMPYKYQITRMVRLQKLNLPSCFNVKSFMASTTLKQRVAEKHSMPWYVPWQAYGHRVSSLRLGVQQRRHLKSNQNEMFNGERHRNSKDRKNYAFWFWNVLRSIRKAAIGQGRTAKSNITTAHFIAIIWCVLHSAGGAVWVSLWVKPAARIKLRSSHPSSTCFTKVAKLC